MYQIRHQQKHEGNRGGKWRTDWKWRFWNWSKEKTEYFSLTADPFLHQFMGCRRWKTCLSECLLHSRNRRCISSIRSDGHNFPCLCISCIWRNYIGTITGSLERREICGMTVFKNCLCRNAVWENASLQKKWKKLLRRVMLLVEKVSNFDYSRSSQPSLLLKTDFILAASFKKGNVFSNEAVRKTQMQRRLHKKRLLKRQWFRQKVSKTARLNSWTMRARS